MWIRCLSRKFARGTWWSSTTLKPYLFRHVAESIERAVAIGPAPAAIQLQDYDPIEELWSKFKGQLRRIATRTNDGLYKAVGEILGQLTIQDILGWFNHSGLYINSWVNLASRAVA